MVADNGKNVSSCALLVIAIVVSQAFTITALTTTTSTMTMATDITEIMTEIMTETVSGPSETSLSLNSSTTSASMDGGTAISTMVMTEIPTISMTTSATDMTTNITDPPSTMSSSSSLSAAVSTTVSTTVTTAPETNLTEFSTTKPATERPKKPQTDPSTELPTEEPKVGPVPETTFPELEGNPNKTYQFEFAVDDNTTAGCQSNNLSSYACEIFKYNITQELIDVYGKKEAFISVEVELRPGSVIVSHNVTYSYNEMTEEQRMASAQDIYNQTLGQAVADGKLGNFTVIEDCYKCTSPKETSNICDLVEPVCPTDLDPICRQNYWACESICFIEKDYCNGNGICWQNSNGEPLCSCDWYNDRWYWGYRCQYYVDQMYLIIGCSCGGAVLLVLLVSLIAYVYVKNCGSHKMTSSSSESDADLINAFQNFVYENGETVFPPIDDMDDGDILQRKRPYSYIYKGEDLTNMESGSSFTKAQNGRTNQRDSRLEVNEDAAKRSNLSNGSTDTRHSSFLKSNGGPQERTPDFWGNLNGQPSEHIKLKPVLDHIDVNESYKIQRPVISLSDSYANTSATPNAYQTKDSRKGQYVLDPDYAQR